MNAAPKTRPTSAPPLTERPRSVASSPAIATGARSQKSIGGNAATSSRPDRSAASNAQRSGVTRRPEPVLTSGATLTR